MPPFRGLVPPFLLAYLALQVTARLLHSVPEDPFASPKYRITFLNGLPVLHDTAQKWLERGLTGGELEFLEQPWRDEAQHREAAWKEIGSGDEQVPLSTSEPSSQITSHSLELMKIGPRISYLCLIPPPLDTPTPPVEEPQQDPTPVHSWSLLQALSGTCLYHRQGWFTYSYCHNSHVRQFREMAHQHPHPPGGYKPEEDPEVSNPKFLVQLYSTYRYQWEAYTLGRAPPIPEPGAELTTAEEAVLAANLELAKSAGSSYLVQRWGDGSVCDKTGRKREIEVQFHCSMTMTDTILFVKETKTCHYVMVIHTPRLCGEPGFKSPLEQPEEAFIRCREVVDSLSGADPTLPESDFPLQVTKSTKPISPPPPLPVDGADRLKQALGSDVLKKALEALIGTDKLTGDEFLVEHYDDGEVVIEFIDADQLMGGGGHDQLAEALRAAGFDIQGEKKGKGKKDKSKEEAEKDGPRNHID
ncbi:hypothetical protein JAAARDRAFT_560164 [Jaapia argillacea MUCL 33604]|uniref:Protein OS-9 homolog n=1 Tax=Jaapia argillacea MUCL 33604 TaxID=933084 RepID=A0A067Q174_9AGAM|nr:hypothetical protein JAAARDRAFT_560164 [Jaapia argillacea MUCL 33604]